MIYNITNYLLYRHFKVVSLDIVLEKLDHLPNQYFLDNLFSDKETYIQQLKDLNNKIKTVYSATYTKENGIWYFNIMTSDENGNCWHRFLKYSKLFIHHISFFYHPKIPSDIIFECYSLN